MVDKCDYLECIAQAVAFIEQQLGSDISVETVAAQVGFSPYHFHRIFTGVLGESVAEYIRKRRLTQAALQLQTTNCNVIEIALDCRFESQEAFTRAFKKMYGLTPGHFRDLNPPIPGKHPATIEMLKHLRGGINMQPEIVIRKAELAIGLGQSFAHESHKEIGQLWSRFKPRMDEIAAQKPGYCLGVCSPCHPEIPLGKGDSFVYLAVLPVSNLDSIPPGMTAVIVPAGRYAKFTHKGPLSELPHTCNYIWGTWLPKCEYERREGPDFELYDQRFDPKTENGEFDIYVPIK